MGYRFQGKYSLQENTLQAIDTKGLSATIPESYSAAVPTVGENIVKLREALGLSQSQLADRLKMRQPSLSKLEKQRGLPNLQTLLKVAKALPSSIEELVVGVDATYDESVADREAKSKRDTPKKTDMTPPVTTPVIDSAPPAEGSSAYPHVAESEPAGDRLHVVSRDAVSSSVDRLFAPIVARLEATARQFERLPDITDQLQSVLAVVAERAVAFDVAPDHERAAASHIVQAATPPVRRPLRGKTRGRRGGKGR